MHTHAIRFHSVPGVKQRVISTHMKVKTGDVHISIMYLLRKTLLSRRCSVDLFVLCSSFYCLRHSVALLDNKINPSVTVRGDRLFWPIPRSSIRSKCRNQFKHVTGDMPIAVNKYRLHINLYRLHINFAYLKYK